MIDSDDLPSGWMTARLGDAVLSITYGYTASASDQAVGPRFLRITDIQDDRVNWSSVPHCVCDSVSKYALKAGDIVVARTGATTGKSFLINELPESTVFASYLIRLETSPTIEAAFVSWFMRSPSYWTQITKVSKGTAQPGANASTLSDLQVPIAPLKEQQRITLRVETLTAKSRRAKEALDAIPPLLERFRQSVLASAFRGDLTAEWRAKNPDVEPADKLLQRIRTERRRRWEESELAKMQAKGKAPGDERWKQKYEEPEPVDAADLPDLPDGWAWASLEELSHRVTDGTHLPPVFEATGIDFLVIGNIINGRIAWDTVHKWISESTYAVLTAGIRPELGDVLYTAVGSYGTAVSVDTDRRFAFQRHIAHIKPLAPIFSTYLAAALNSPMMMARAHEVARGVAQKTVTLGELKRFPIPVCHEREQLKVIEAVEAMSARLDAVRDGCGSTLRRLGDLNRSILAKAFRGELVPQDPTDEPASVLLDRIRRERAAAELPKAKKPPKRPR